MADSLLARLLVQFVGPEHQNAQFHAPFSVLVEGSPWAVAVSGPTLMAVRGKASYPLVVNEDVQTILSLKPNSSEAVSMATLKEWCGPAEPFLQHGVVRGRLFDRARLAGLLTPIPFPKLSLWVTLYNEIPALVLDAPSRWRALLAGIDGDPDPADPVWGKSAEAQIFDLAMSMA
jgi:hypothetical protein